MKYDHSLLEERFKRDGEVYVFPSNLYKNITDDNDPIWRDCAENPRWYDNPQYTRLTGIDEVEMMLSELETLFKKDSIPMRYLNYVATNFTHAQKLHFCMNVEVRDVRAPTHPYAIYPDSEIDRTKETLFVSRVENHSQADNKRKYYSELLNDPEAFKKWEFYTRPFSSGNTPLIKHPLWYSQNVYQPRVVSINDYKTGDMLTIEQVRALCKGKEDDDLIDLLKNIEYKRVNNAMWHPVYKIPKVKDAGSLDRCNYRTWRVVHIKDHSDSNNKNDYYDSLKSNGKPQSWQKLTENGTWQTLHSGSHPIWGTFQYRCAPKGDLIFDGKKVSGVIDFAKLRAKLSSGTSFTDIMKGRSGLGKDLPLMFLEPYPFKFFAHVIPRDFEVHGKKLSAPLDRTPANGDIVFIPSLAATDLYFKTSWIASEHQEIMLKRGLVFKSKDAAIAVSKHLLEGNSAFKGYK